LADWLDSRLQGDEDHLPDRILEVFTHGMGGLFDRHTTAAKNQLAERLHNEAKRQQNLRSNRH
jgi:hypothetical protein